MKLMIAKLCSCLAEFRNTTKHKPENTNVGEQVLDLVIPYIHNVDDQNSVSLVSRKFYQIDGITRKRLTVHTFYYPNPASLSKRFPFIESLTLKGPPFNVYRRNGYDIRITPWIEQLALEFTCLKELHIHRVVVRDEDLWALARTRGKDLRSLKINKCIGFSAVGLRHVSKYCNQLRTLCLKNPDSFIVCDATWLHQLAFNSTVLERLHVTNTDNSEEDLTLLAKKCCNSLVSLKIGKCYLSKLGDGFRYAVKLEHFGGYICDAESELVGFQFPHNIHYLSRMKLPVTRYLSVLPILNQIKKLKLVLSWKDAECECLLFKSFPNLEVLYTADVCGDRGLQVIGDFCKKLRKLTYCRFVTHVGLISLAKGCTNLESLDVLVKDMSNEALKCVGTHLKNLRHFRMWFGYKNSKTNLTLDNGFRAMLIGCSKLERLDISHLWHGVLTDVGLEYIGKYGVNLRSLGLECVGNSNAGLVKLSQGCLKLRKLMIDCPFSEQVVTSSVFKIRSLRYVGGWSSDRTVLALTRPEFQL